MLVIELELLTGRYVATAHNDRGRAEWPPHPARLFSALVAALHDREPSLPAEREALLWLEQQPSPSLDVDVESEVSRRTVSDVYVPVNDVTVMGDIDDEAMRRATAALETLRAGAGSAPAIRTAERAARKEARAFAAGIARANAVEAQPPLSALKQAAAVLPDRRTRQVRTFPVVVPQRPTVAFMWECEIPVGIVSSSNDLCRRVTRLGHSSSLVRCTALAAQRTPTLVPSDTGTLVLRAVGAGQVERLEREFARHRAVEPRVLPALPQASEPARTGSPAASFRESVFSDESIVFERVGGARPLASRGPTYTRALKSALLEIHGALDLPASISGHEQGGTPIAGPHVAFVALPFVGHQHADGTVLGLAIVLPRGMDAGDRRTLLRLVSRWEHDRAIEQDGTLEVAAPSAPPVRIARVELSEKLTLTAWRWSRPATRFVTATPVALDGNPGNLQKQPLRDRGEGRRGSTAQHRRRMRAHRTPAAGTRGGIAAYRSSPVPNTCGRFSRGRPGLGARPVFVFTPTSRSVRRCRVQSSLGPGVTLVSGSAFQWWMWDSSMPLSVDDFAAFHAAVHRGFQPFPWQTRLLRSVVQERRWPAVLNLPTGSGKTSCIDIALFALALDASDPKERWCPRRIALVVDRRIVVDQAAARGRVLLDALCNPSAPQVVRDVAACLRSLGSDGTEPLAICPLRGGIPKDDGSARTPDQPLVIASTVDQVGCQAPAPRLWCHPQHATGARGSAGE